MIFKSFVYVYLNAESKKAGNKKIYFNLNKLVVCEDGMFLSVNDDLKKIKALLYDKSGYFINVDFEPNLQLSYTFFLFIDDRKTT